VKKYQQINRQRKNRVFRVSNAVKRSSTRVRLAVFRSNTNIYAQIIDDEAGKTLVSASSRDKALKAEIPNGGNAVAAEKIGDAVAKKALAAGIKQVKFDRHGFKYHGRIKALADAARKAGLDIGAAGEPKEVKPGKADEKKTAKAPAKSKADKEAAKIAASKATSKKGK
jgi:large subunit ribosomal protein L18